MASEAATQQNKMKDCSEQAKAKGLGEGKGDERQAFMKECLSAKSTKSGKTAQQEKMKACNKEAGEKSLTNQSTAVTIESFQLSGGRMVMSLAGLGHVAVFELLAEFDQLLF